MESQAAGIKIKDDGFIPLNGINCMIKNIIFDVGGVLVDYRWKEYIEDYGYKKAQAEVSGLRLLNDPIWRNMDKGLVSEAEVRSYYLEKYPEDEGLINYFFDNADQMIVKRDRLYKVIEGLYDKDYDFYILSNYSMRLFDLHTAHLQDFFNRCKGIVVSQPIKMLKPEPEIYDYILTKYELDPAECIFFDDNEDNVKAAIEAGIDARCVKSEEGLIELLNEFN